LSSGGAPVSNTASPYFNDPTWGYGLRTPISGTLQLDSSAGTGSGTANPFSFFNKGQATFSNVVFQSIGGGLMLGNMSFNWSGSTFTTQIVLDASGLFAEIPTIAIDDVYDGTTCAISMACATPASNGIKAGSYPIGPVPVATSSFNNTDQTGFGTTLGQLSLGTDDGIGGSPMDNGTVSGSNINFDFTSLTVTNVSTIPVPAAAWLFGSGLIGLISVARRRKT